MPEKKTSDKLKKSNSFEQWDWLTAKFVGASNLPFLLLQLPQIILNTRNLMAGNKSALLAVPWLGMFTGLLGNLSLLSYFANKRETEVVVVQTLGVLAMAGAMPLPHFVITSFVVASGLVLNFLYYFELLNPGIWRFWEDSLPLLGSLHFPNILPVVMAFIIVVVAVIMVNVIFIVVFRCIRSSIWRCKDCQTNNARQQKSHYKDGEKVYSNLKGLFSSAIYVTNRIINVKLNQVMDHGGF
ncbi:unnamed protein product [Ilex paraguariensis]|uniref:Uncharacterized protein n=1 Tax=Ilex paraguariensis TaxID=185542 RepID=A0ABC8T5G8_9AQUA